MIDKIKNTIKRDEDNETQQFDLNQILAAIARDKAAADDATQFEADEDFVTDRLRAELVAQVRTVMRIKNIKNPAALAKLTGVSAPRISAILQEKGNITLRVIAKLAIALDTKVNLQFGEAVKPSLVSYKSVAINQHRLVFHTKLPKIAAEDSWVNERKLPTSVSKLPTRQSNSTFTVPLVEQSC